VHGDVRLLAVAVDLDEVVASAEGAELSLKTIAWHASASV
jgi:hypothetical protein